MISKLSPERRGGYGHAKDRERDIGRETNRCRDSKKEKLRVVKKLKTIIGYKFDKNKLI